MEVIVSHSSCHLGSQLKFSQPSVIIAVFLFIGTAAFLFIKARKGFGYFANYFSACICLGACLYGIRGQFH